MIEARKILFIFSTAWLTLWLILGFGMLFIRPEPITNEIGYHLKILILCLAIGIVPFSIFLLINLILNKKSRVMIGSQSIESDISMYPQISYVKLIRKTLSILIVLMVIIKTIFTISLKINTISIIKDNDRIYSQLVRNMIIDSIPGLIIGVILLILAYLLWPRRKKSREYFESAPKIER